MGRYFGIANTTQNHKVSSGIECWKGYIFCSCHAVMHRYHWNNNDIIFSACYDTYTPFEFNKEDNVMMDISTEEQEERSRAQFIKEQEERLYKNAKEFLVNDNQLIKIINKAFEKCDKKYKIRPLILTYDFVYDTIKSYLEIKISQVENTPIVYVDVDDTVINCIDCELPRNSFYTFIEPNVDNAINNYYDIEIYAKVREIQTKSTKTTYDLNMIKLYNSWYTREQQSHNKAHNYYEKHLIDLIEGACKSFGNTDDWHDSDGLMISDSEISDSDDESSEFDNNIKNIDEQPKVDTSIKLGYSPEINMELQSDHAPVWNGNICQICKYQFNNNDIYNDSEKFDSAFYMA